MKNLPFRKRFRFAFSGWFYAFRSEKSFRTQVAMTVLAIILLAWIQPKPVWWALVIVAIGMVLSSELMNTAMEATLDLLHPDKHPKIQVAKDCLAGAVLVCSTVAIGILVALLMDYLLF